MRVREGKGCEDSVERGEREREREGDVGCIDLVRLCERGERIQQTERGGAGYGFCLVERFFFGELLSIF
jgi:hypothetical protein